MTSAWLSLARVAPVGAVTTHLAASAVSATKASPRTAQAVPVKVELGFGWSPGPGLQSRGLPGKPSDPVRVSQTWMSVTGPTAASTAVRMSWGATAVAALRASPRTPSGASVWVSVRGWEEAGAPPQDLSRVGNWEPPHPGCCDKRNYPKDKWAGLGGRAPPHLHCWGGWGVRGPRSKLGKAQVRFLGSGSLGGSAEKDSESVPGITGTECCDRLVMPAKGVAIGTRSVHATSLQSPCRGPQSGGLAFCTPTFSTACFSLCSRPCS